jgi:hypothetical protein
MLLFKFFFFRKICKTLDILFQVCIFFLNEGPECLYSLLYE